MQEHLLDKEGTTGAEQNNDAAEIKTAQSKRWRTIDVALLFSILLVVGFLSYVAYNKYCQLRTAKEITANITKDDLLEQEGQPDSWWKYSANGLECILAYDKSLLAKDMPVNESWVFEYYKKRDPVCVFIQQGIVTKIVSGRLLDSKDNL